MKEYIVPVAESDKDFEDVYVADIRQHKELILCRDCKWYGRADKRRFYRGADCLQGHLHTIVPDRDYCSRAEPKETEE